MAATPPTREGVRAHADEIIARATADGRLTPDGEAAKAAGLVPVFSKGTAALDPNTGKPIIPKDQAKVPEFTEGEKKPLPGEPNAEIVAPAAASPAPVATSAPAIAPPQAEAGAAAAEAAATAIAEEYDEFEFEDPNFDGGAVKIPIRVPKRFAASAKRGYDKRTTYDRAVSYLKNADPVLRAMIEDGRINQLLPLIKAAMENDDYGKFVTGGFQRLTQGLPLVEQARIEAAAAGAAAGAALDESVNPFVDPEMVTLRERTAAIEREWTEEKERRQQTQQAQQQQQAQVQRNIANMQGAHQDLAAAYPGMFNPQLGDQDPAWKAAYKYAEEAGYLRRYDLRAAIVFGGQGWRGLEAERLAATASPAAVALGQMDTELANAAAREAAAAARTVAGGAVATAIPAAIPPKPVPTYPPGQAPLDANGKPVLLKPKDVFMAEMLAWQQQYGRLKEA